MKKLLFTTLRKVVLAMLTLWCCQFLSAQTWSPVKGVQAQDISIGSEGEVWIIGKDNTIMRWNGSAFEKMKGSAKRISVGADGTPWIVTSAGKVGYYDLENNKWVQVAGNARDVGVGADGSVWIVGTKAMEGGFVVSKWDNDEESWEEMEFGAVRIAVDGEGNPWMVNDEHKIVAYIEEELHEYGEETLDVGVGGDGSIWAITSEKGIVRLEDEGWVEVGSNAIGIAATSEGTPWIVNVNGQVARLAKLVADEENDSDEDVADAKEEKEEVVEKPKAVNTRMKETVKEKSDVEDENKTKTKEVMEKGPNQNKPVEKSAPAPRYGTPVEFFNSGNKPVKVYTSSSSQLGDLVTEIRPNSRVKVPVNIGDEFEVAVGEDFGRHPKIYITSTSSNVVLFGNGPLKDVQFLAEKFAILDYQSNQAGIDLTTYNPRNLVNTINKGRIFEMLDIVEGVDYRIVGGGKILKYGFEYASTNLHEGSNEVTMSYGYSSFAKNWSVNVGGSGTIPIPKTPVSLTPALDFGYKEQESENRSFENSYAFTKEQKSVFTISVNPKQAQLESAFKDAVLNVSDINSANEFVNEYGTHYAKSIHYGGDRSVYVVMTKEEYKKAKGFGINVKGKIGASMGKAGTKQGSFGSQQTSQKKTQDGEMAEGHFAVEYSEDREEQSALEKAVAKYRIIGGAGGFDEWTVNEDNAAPVSAQLELIYTLIDPTIFKDKSAPAILAKARGLIETAVTNKIKGMPLLNAPLPPPNIYKIIIEKLEVTQEIDDANKKTKGNFTAGISWQENGKTVATEETPQFCIFPEYSLDFKFVKGTIVYPNKVYTFSDFPDSKTGKFRTVTLNIRGLINEKDDLNKDANDAMYGETGNINVTALNLSPGQLSEPKIFNLDYHAFGHENQIKVTYRIMREPSDFNDKLLKW